MKIIFFFLISLSAFSFAQKTTIYFYSSSDVSKILEKAKPRYYAVNTLALKCQKMGEYCFDPQVGLYKPENRNQAVKIKDDNSTEARYKKVRGLGADGFFNQEMINCDKNKFYDIYCNKSGSKTRSKILNNKFEVWMDTSKIMKVRDNEPLEDSCQRSYFLNLLQSTCSKSNSFKVFALSNIKKRLGANIQACQNSSSDIDLDKLKSWIKFSNAKRLFIFLDEYYAQGKLLSFLKTKSNIEVKGIDTKVLLAKMDNEISELKQYCN